MDDLAVHLDPPNGLIVGYKDVRHDEFWVPGHMPGYPLLPGVRHHHEKYDGSGHPDGLRGEEIPIEARIMAVADAFDAMTSSRPYRKPMPEEEALAELRAAAGSQFDPRVVAAFEQIYPAVKRTLEHLRPRLAAVPDP